MRIRWDKRSLAVAAGLAGVALIVILAASHALRPAAIFPVVLNGKFGYIDRSGKLLIRPQFNGAGSYAEGLAPVEQGTHWG